MMLDQLLKEIRTKEGKISSTIGLVNLSQYYVDKENIGKKNEGVDKKYLRILI